MKKIEEMTWDELQPLIHDGGKDDAAFERAWCRKLELEHAELIAMLDVPGWTLIQLSALHQSVHSVGLDLNDARHELRRSQP